jgi:uncharacterized integral membrane protein
VNTPDTRDGARTPWSVTLTVAGMALILIAMMLFALTSDAPITVRLAALVMLFPAGYFAMLAWVFTYDAVTGRRPPGAAQVNRLFGFLNRKL